MKCATCNGVGKVITWLPHWRLSEGFLAFMRAGRTLQHDTEGRAYDEIVCLRCDGSGQATATPEST